MRAWVATCVVVSITGCPDRRADRTDATTALPVDAAPPDARTCWEGDASIHDVEDLAPLAGVECVTGDVTIDAPGLEVELPELRLIEGDLVVLDAAAVRMPRLEQVGTFGAQAPPSLTELSLPRLRYASLFSVDGASSLVSLDLPALAEVVLLAHVTNNPVLERVILPSLLGAAEVAISFNPSLFAVDLSALSYGSLHVVDDPALAEVVLPSYTNGQSLILVRGSQLAHVAAPALVSLDAFVAEDNPLLPTCALWALLDGVAISPGEITIAGNDDAATCP